MTDDTAPRTAEATGNGARRPVPGARPGPSSGPRAALSRQLAKAGSRHSSPDAPDSGPSGATGSSTPSGATPATVAARTRTRTRGGVTPVVAPDDVTVSSTAGPATTPSTDPASSGTGTPRRLRLRDLVGSAPVICGLLTALLVWSGTMAYASTLSPSYSSTAVVSFAPRDAVTTGAETMVLVVPKYVELLGSPTMLDRAAEQLGVDADVVRTRSTGIIEPNTLNLRIEVTEGDPEAAADTAAVLAAGVVQTAAGDPLVSAELVAPAAADPLPIVPTPSQLRLLGLGIGLVAGLLVALGLARRRPGWREFWGSRADPSLVVGSAGRIEPSTA